MIRPFLPTFSFLAIFFFGGGLRQPTERAYHCLWLPEWMQGQRNSSSAMWSQSTYGAYLIDLSWLWTQSTYGICLHVFQSTVDSVDIRNLLACFSVDCGLRRHTEFVCVASVDLVSHWPIWAEKQLWCYPEIRIYDTKFYKQISLWKEYILHKGDMWEVSESHVHCLRFLIKCTTFIEATLQRSVMTDEML